MGLPIEDQALEHVHNDSALNIHKGRIAAYKALCVYLGEGVQNLDDTFVPEIAPNDQRLDNMAMTSYNSIRNAWIAMYENWNYRDVFVVVECNNGSIYTQVNKHVHRASDHSQATLF